MSRIIVAFMIAFAASTSSACGANLVPLCTPNPPTQLCT